MGAVRPLSGSHIKNVELLGSGEKLEWRQTDSGREVKMPLRSGKVCLCIEGYAGALGAYLSVKQPHLLYSARRLSTGLTNAARRAGR